MEATCYYIIVCQEKFYYLFQQIFYVDLASNVTNI